MDEEGLTLDRHFQYMAAVAREKITLFRNVLVTKKAVCTNSYRVVCIIQVWFLLMSGIISSGCLGHSNEGVLEK